MTSFRLAATELRRLTSGKLPKLALLAITLVPLLYGALYIYANWDPYERLDAVPAAVVVDDTGAPRDDGSRLQAGADVEQELVDSGSFDWNRTDEQQARQGVASGEYNFALVVPEDFSAALLSPGEFDPRQAQLQLITNDANNYLTGTIADQVAAEVRDGVAANSGSEAAGEFLLGFSTVHDKTVEAARGAGELADGAGQLDDGIGQARDGTEQLSAGSHELLDGQHRLADGASQLADGTGELTGGADQLHGGLRQLQDSTAQLPEQTEQLADGAEQVAAGNEELATRAENLGGVSQDIADNLDSTKQDIIGQLRAAGTDEETVQRIANGLDELNSPLTDANDTVQGQVGQLRTLADGAQQVADGNRTLADATPAMTTAIGRLTDGAGALSGGAQQLDDGAQQLRSGTGEAVDGTQQLTDGADELAGGTRQLADGSGQLADGSTTLATELGDGAGDIPNPDEQTREATAEAIGDPVAVDTQAQVEADSYGAGLAPFFMGLALWIGGFVLFLLMRPLSTRALAAGVAPWRVALGGWLPAAVVGLAQAVLLHLVVAYGIGLNPAHPWGTLGFLALTSFAFTAVVHALNAAFGPRGKFIALIVLVLQLVTAGGTFPWQTIPEPLHPLHQVLPLTYVVDGLRYLLYGGVDSSALTSAIAVLLCYLAAGLLLSTVAAWRQRVWTPGKLKPELSL
ncbi:YhgE/Pip domain-containing protein [Saccharopolyspora sp. HNM0983]|uniref:YhgE/Pip domain-containing protein n=1 Tax=Saccharopolyspora montiporae TaxID=2781240 RepID=A0A929BDL9_9PSEU|nr:YhgE/Pip domain-containing protein [Saccharopolyspora sp. HNM0983]MBE9375567.1 YhgE/Pip domain-containing protein [Saccharopolyspora sp. HNM0983]